MSESVASALRVVLASSLFFLVPARCGAGQPRSVGGAAGILGRLSMEPAGEFVRSTQAFDALEQCNFCEWTCLLVPAGAQSPPLQWSPSATPMSECLRVCVHACGRASLCAPRRRRGGRRVQRGRVGTLPVRRYRARRAKGKSGALGPGLPFLAPFAEPRSSDILVFIGTSLVTTAPVGAFTQS